MLDIDYERSCEMSNGNSEWSGVCDVSISESESEAKRIEIEDSALDEVNACFFEKCIIVDSFRLGV